MERVPRLLVWLVQLGIFVLAGVASFLLRFDFAIPAPFVMHFVWAIPIWLITKAVVFRLYSLDRGWWRFVSVHDVLRVGLGNLVGSSVSAVLILVLAPRGFPRSLFFLDLLICSLLTCSVRILTRIVQDSLHNGHVTAGERTVLIYGAGASGITLLREIRSNAALKYRAIGFVDDHPHKRGVVIQGAKVLGSGADLAVLVEKYKVEEILIALPSATGQEMAAILSLCHKAGVRCRTIPALAEVIEDRALATQIRDVAVEDLLGRNPVTLEEAAIGAKLENQVILVTGAAGSIGSELCRQIARFRPRAIVGYEIAETPLFHLEGEMGRVFPGVSFFPEIGSIQNPRRLAEVLSRHSPSVVYHAAAYKHVPMMENHIFEAIENNVFGTWNVASAARCHGVTDFVMISSDKAVRPTSVMGLTKRVAELVIQEMQNGGTRFVSVRFGNVLGSNGSVIPLFKSQIARGGPVTVTHPDMRRYFMTIPEACQLVLQASSMGLGGELFVLDMGQPVKICDLARNLILLSGLRPDQDIQIEFTGPRPGEKLYEELSTLEEETLPTWHEKIKIFAGNGLPPGGMMQHLQAMRRHCEERDTRALILHLKDLVPEYNPSHHLLRSVLQPEAARVLAASAG